MKPTSPIWKLLEFYGTRIHHRGKWRVHELLCAALHANCDCDLEVERQGLRWSLNPADFVQRHLYWTGEYEYLDVHHLYGWLRPGAVVFDVGANFGYYSLMLASAMQGSGQVFAFEPCSAAYGRLQKNIALNNFYSRITAIQCGLSDTPGTAFLRSVRGNSGATAISREVTGEKISLDSLDHFCTTNNIQTLDILKLDVEGSELQVLQGGSAVLSKKKPVMMIELNACGLESAGASVGEVANMLQAWGYELLVARRERLIPLEALPQRGQIMNVFCVPTGSAEAVASRFHVA